MTSRTPDSSGTPPDPSSSGPEESSLEAIDNSLLRVLVSDRWFRRAAVAITLFVAAVLLTVIPLFVVSTPEIDPPYRVSLLDKFQARSLIRTAREAGKAGRLPDSMTAWRTALANDPSSLEACQGALEVLTAAAQWSPDDVLFGYGCGMQLLKRSGTNAEDVVRFARFLDHVGHHDANVVLLRERAAEDNGELAGWFARSLFLARRMDRFDELWHRQRKNLTVTEPMKLIAIAWEAGWGPVTRMAAARERLSAAETDPQRHAEASHLLLRVFEQVGDAPAYERTLARRVERHEESLDDHLGLWRLLARTGRTAEALEHLGAYRRSPANPGEAVGLMEALQAFGLADRAAEVGLEQVKVFPHAPHLWLAAAEILLQRRDWPRLRQLAIGMRGETTCAGSMGAYSWYLDGRIDLDLNREWDAAADFARIAECSTPDAVMVARMVAGLRRVDRTQDASALLRRVQKDFEKDATFWFELAAIASETQDMDTLAEAVSRSYRLDPTHPVYRHNHAAVMIALGREPEETVRLTFELLNRSPESVPCQINHALALVNHRRFSDAENLLARIPWAGRTTVEETQIHYTWMLIEEARQRADAARVHAAAVRESELLPPQRKKREAVLGSKKPG